MGEAKKGRITEEMFIVAKEESISTRELLKKIADGKVVILKNVNHEGVHPVAVGEGVRTKVNANIGTSSIMADLQTEIEKAKIAIHYARASLGARSPATKARALVMGGFLVSDEAMWNIFMAVGVIYSIPPIIFYYSFKRYLVTGIFKGAVKL